MTGTEDKADRETDAPASGRASYLIAGRRVRVADLVHAGLLDVGTQLVFTRPRMGTTHFAEVSKDHAIRLTDGRQFASPSRAAKAAVGHGSFDGWNAWALRDGTTLDALRQRLLDSLAKQAPLGSQDAQFASARHERLKKAREAAAEGHPVTLTVRELFGWWGAARRGHLISDQVAGELSNHALSTSPDFGAVPLDTSVRLVRKSIEQEGRQGADEQPALLVGAPDHAGEAEHVGETEREDTGVDEADDSEREPITDLTVGRLASALSGVVSISPQATFDEAITKMTLNDYSQLPVITGSRNLQGAVTWESIAMARHTDADAPFSQAVIPAHAVPYDHHLVDVLPQLALFGFVLVRDETNVIAGIVTSNDAAAAYGALATPFSLIGELDQRLRRIISDAIDLTDAVALCNTDDGGGIVSFDELSFGDYQRILENPSLWAKLGWPLDRRVFVKRLDDLRKIRNELMHFNSDGVEEEDVRKIRRMIAVLRKYGD
ncbi:restriction system modified-DNA reader domain-containing protein [Streptomyces bohaiensis]|uniref:CBS domain-containing protein n=1 Tax=Streptomyces bohaiensis TaxID=1431344 RepID=A0ABX1CD48_9ACTN|nr:CBS domain-containing protein [Streptomyces bohaiensis]NJQ15670.1 CBS domain-containing protein [Streptomyces bohaiensis]